MKKWSDEVAEEIALRGLFREGDRILVAVSGGVDSMVLLSLLHGLAKANKWHLEAGHFNHQLRGNESEEDARLVEKTARNLLIPLQSGRGDVRGHAKLNGISLEMAGRELRHRYLAETALERGCRVIALAHHLDDQIELFFLRLLRGAGSLGIAGMEWKNRSPAHRGVFLARPLLGRTRSEILEFARSQLIEFREDASNHSLNIPRNRIRRQLIPMLEGWQPNLRQTVSRLMEIVRGDAEFVGGIAHAWVNKLAFGDFKELCPAMQRRILERQLIEAGLPVSFDLVETLRLHAETRVSAASGRLVTRNEEGRLVLCPLVETGFDPAEIMVPLSGEAGCATFSGVDIAWRRKSGAAGPFGDGRKTGLERFDSALVGDGVVLRHWQAGDRYQPAGMSYSKKLQDLFVDLKVPRGERKQRLTGATLDGRLFWVEGLRISQQFKVTPRTKNCLEWRWDRPKRSIAG